MLSSNWRKAARAGLIVWLICMAVTAFASTLPSPTADFYVNDFAGVLSKETHDAILQTGAALADQTGAQVVVVTLETTGETDLETFATELYRAYGIGDREHSRGVLLLLVTGDRNVRIEVGYGLEGAINDAKAGRILDTYVVPYLQHDQWDEGVLNGFRALVQEVRTEFPAEIESGEPREYKEPKYWETWEGQFVIGLAISLALGALFTKILKSAAKWAILAWLVAITVYFLVTAGIFAAASSMFCSGVAALFGNAAVSPGKGRGRGADDARQGNRRSGGSSGGRGYSGGGGRSGGGGASRGF